MGRFYECPLRTTKFTALSSALLLCRRGVVGVDALHLIFEPKITLTRSCSWDGWMSKMRWCRCWRRRRPAQRSSHGLASYIQTQLARLVGSRWSQGYMKTPPG